MRDTAAFQNASLTMSDPRGSNNYVSHHMRCGMGYGRGSEKGPNTKIIQDKLMLANEIYV